MQFIRKAQKKVYPVSTTCGLSDKIQILSLDLLKGSVKNTLFEHFFNKGKRLYQLGKIIFQKYIALP
ncbi:MAG: hypothetical protein DSY90_01165 [Deltaproteobacteria bacterium]|nr:MAG: hypothetical protein DSY90_01165 [Deltaproteobacteria bacterium]